MTLSFPGIFHVLRLRNLVNQTSVFFVALILEEVAIDSIDACKKDKLLLEAEELHLESLKLARLVRCIG